MEKIAWLGLDAHAKSSLLAWIDNEGRRLKHWRFPTTERDLIKHLEMVSASTKRLALEECGLGRWLGQVARRHVSEVMVCDPKENKRISRHHHKCDEEDAYTLARLYRSGDLKKVWHSPDDARAVFKCATQAYLDAVNRQTRLKLQIKAHYRQWGVIPSGSSVYSLMGRKRYLDQVQQPGVRQQQQLLYEMLDAALEGERKARRLMVEGGKSFPEIARLRTVPGVGAVGAHLFVAYIQEPRRFERQQQLFHYCRLGIRDRSSDGKPLGYQRLDRDGHGVLKAISYRAWLMAMKTKRGAIYDFYAASLKRTGDAVHARLNTQRKILHTLWVLWKKETTFDPNTFLGTEA